MVSDVPLAAVSILLAGVILLYVWDSNKQRIIDECTMNEGENFMYILAEDECQGYIAELVGGGEWCFQGMRKGVVDDTTESGLLPITFATLTKKVAEEKCQ